MIVLVCGGKISILVDRNNTTRLTTDGFMDVTFAVQDKDDSRKPFIDLSWNGINYKNGHTPVDLVTLDITDATAMHIYAGHMKVFRAALIEGSQVIQELMLPRKLTENSVLLSVLGVESDITRITLNNYILDQTDDLPHDQLLDWLCDNITRITRDSSRRVLYTWDIDALYGNLACWTDHRDLSKLVRPERRVISGDVPIQEMLPMDVPGIPEPQ